jgi:hypothetical protein
MEKRRRKGEEDVFSFELIKALKEERGKGRKVGKWVRGEEVEEKVKKVNDINQCISILSICNIPLFLSFYLSLFIFIFSPVLDV